MDISWYAKFERYVNFEFYKTLGITDDSELGLRDM